LANDLNAGPNGAAVTAPNSGAGGAAFHVVAAQGASLTYDASPAMGAYAAQHALSSRGNAYYEWDGTFTTSYGRVYVWLDDQPDGALRLVRLTSGGSLRAALDVLRTGYLRFVDSANRTIAATTTSIATGRWVRIEWRVSHGTGTVEIRLYNDAGSTSPTVTVTSGSGSALGPSATAVQIGRSGSQSSAITFWTDNPAVSTGGWLGRA
jgi:hypothetical protein